MRIKELYFKVEKNSSYIFINFFYINKFKKKLYIKTKNKNKNNNNNNNNNNKVENKRKGKKEDKEEFIKDLAI